MGEMFAEPPAYRYAAMLVRVVDGDTFYADVDLGFYVSRVVDVRCRGFNAPERGTPGAEEATAKLQQLLSAGPFIIESHKTSAGTADRSFARWVCDVWLADGTSLADAMISAGVAVREDG